MVNELNQKKNNPLKYTKTKAQISFKLTTKLISNFVLVTKISKPLFFLSIQPFSDAVCPSLGKT